MLRAIPGRIRNRTLNTFEFFNQHFGRFLTEQTGDAIADAQKALSMNHPLLSGKTSRLGSGWAIIRPNRSTLQLGVRCSGEIEIAGNTVTRFAAFLEDLQKWNGEPRIYLTFDKRPVPASNLFVTYDPRLVRICSPTAIETFDFTQPPRDTSGAVHRNIYKELSIKGVQNGVHH